jgi:hypothetical protein
MELGNIEDNGVLAIKARIISNLCRLNHLLSVLRNTYGGNEEYTNYEAVENLYRRGLYLFAKIFQFNFYRQRHCV